VIIDEEILDMIIDYSDKYIYDRNEPDRSIDILDEVCAKVSIEETNENLKLKELERILSKIVKQKNRFILDQNFDEASNLKEQEDKINTEINNMRLDMVSKPIVKKVSKEDIVNVISLKAKVPIYEISSSHKEQFNALESILKSNIIGQDECIEKLISTTKKMKLGLKEERKPISFLFVGPSGVGKTDLVKIYTENLYGKEKLIRLDMSEFAESHSISKIVGSSPGYVGYEDNKNILEDVKNKPYSVILLDEIEKAHPKILNLFLQVLDEGFIKDSKGSKVRFDNTIIIMTSNIGYNKTTVGFNNSKEKTITDLKEYLNVEFINRIDNIIFFKNLTKDIVTKIVSKEIDTLIKKYQEKEVSLSIGKNVINKIVTLSNYEEFGARQIKKIIKDKLESIIIDKIIMGEDKINITSLNKEKMKS